jgi:hypothetical protein
MTYCLFLGWDWQAIFGAAAVIADQPDMQFQAITLSTICQEFFVPGTVLIWIVAPASRRHWSPDESGRYGQVGTAPRGLAKAPDFRDVRSPEGTCQGLRRPGHGVLLAAPSGHRRPQTARSAPAARRGGPRSKNWG